jgi:hypothetical protein
MASLTTSQRIRVEVTRHPSSDSPSDVRWTDACQRFTAAVPQCIRGSVERALHGLHGGGSGLRAWVSSVAWRGGKLPQEIPQQLVQVYLDDPEAAPLYDCESCGVAIPVRPNRIEGVEAEPELTYFTTCPCCGGRTGLYLYVSRQAEGEDAFDVNATNLRHRKPR